MGESGRELRKVQGFREWGRGAVDAGRVEPAGDAGRDPHGRGWRLMIFCARVTRGLRRPSPGLTARLGVPVGGRVRKLRGVEDQSAPIPEEITSKLGGSIRGQTRWSPVLVQRAVSEDPRWTRAVGDHLARPQRRSWKSGGRSMRAVKGHFRPPFEGM